MAAVLLQMGQVLQEHKVPLSILFLVRPSKRVCINNTERSSFTPFESIETLALNDIIYTKKLNVWELILTATNLHTSNSAAYVFSN